MNLQTAVLLYRLGRAKGQDLVDAALSGMESGLESDNLHVLAGLSDPAMRDASPLFESALEDLHIAMPPTKREAAIALAKTYASEIVAGELSPRTGCHRLYRLWNDSDRADSLTPFVGYSDDLDEEMTAIDQADEPLRNRKDKRLTELEQLIVEAAKEFLASDIPR